MNSVHPFLFRSEQESRFPLFLHMKHPSHANGGFLGKDWPISHTWRIGVWFQTLLVRQWSPIWVTTCGYALNLILELLFLSMQFLTGCQKHEMEIGYPTDVKHVAHIGWDGPSVGGPSWVRNSSQRFIFFIWRDFKLRNHIHQVQYMNHGVDQYCDAMLVEAC